MSAITKRALELVRVLHCDRCAYINDSDPSSIIVAKDEPLPAHWGGRGDEHLCWHCWRGLARNAGVGVDARDAIWAAWDVRPEGGP